VARGQKWGAGDSGMDGELLEFLSPVELVPGWNSCRFVRFPWPIRVGIEVN
jgi:hypothetical protein